MDDAPCNHVDGKCKQHTFPLNLAFTVYILPYHVHYVSIQNVRKVSTVTHAYIAVSVWMTPLVITWTGNATVPTEELVTHVKKVNEKKKLLDL